MLNRLVLWKRWRGSGRRQPVNSVKLRRRRRIYPRYCKLGVSEVRKVVAWNSGRGEKKRNSINSGYSIAAFLPKLFLKEERLRLGKARGRRRTEPISIERNCWL